MDCFRDLVTHKTHLMTFDPDLTSYEGIRLYNKARSFTNWCADFYRFRCPFSGKCKHKFEIPLCLIDTDSEIALDDPRPKDVPRMRSLEMEYIYMSNQFKYSH